jgi:hypothetical protein
MRKSIVTMLALSLLLPCMALAGGDEFFDMIGSINTSARINLPGFKADVSAEFGIPVPRIDLLLATIPDPGDVYMCLQLGHALNRPPEDVAKTYQKEKGKGWGVIAQEMGIKPGSPEFHALKNGKYAQKAKGGKGGGNEGGKGKGGEDQSKGKGKKK